MLKHPLQPIRLPAAHKKTLYAVFTLLWLSGALWLLFHYTQRVAGEFGSTAHPLEIWWLRLHGLMGFAMLVLIGSLLPGHTRSAWRLKKNRPSGLGMKLLFGWLTLTGYCLYYFISEANEAWLPALHWSIGLAAPVVLILHIRLGRQRHAPASQAPAWRPRTPSRQP